jgi:O-methyltransferase
LRPIRRRLSRLLRPQQEQGPQTTFTFSSSLTDEERATVKAAEAHSITSTERLVANMDAAAYVAKRSIPGAIVECGVWRGGSILVMISTLQRLGVTDRDIYLFDTFEGMTQPSDADISRFDGSALEAWQGAGDRGTPWDHFFTPELFGLEHVKELMYATGYPRERIHFVVGRVEDTIPGQAPEQIALLRLDTDWYESTKHELDHLYPRISDGGVLIVDDYGHWDGCRRAVDEYFDGLGRPVLLSRIDYTGRIAIKH